MDASNANMITAIRRSPGDRPRSRHVSLGGGGRPDLGAIGNSMENIYYALAKEANIIRKEDPEGVLGPFFFMASAGDMLIIMPVSHNGSVEYLKLFSNPASNARIESIGYVGTEIKGIDCPVTPDESPFSADRWDSTVRVFSGVIADTVNGKDFGDCYSHYLMYILDAVPHDAKLRAIKYVEGLVRVMAAAAAEKLMATDVIHVLFGEGEILKQGITAHKAMFRITASGSNGPKAPESRSAEANGIQSGLIVNPDPSRMGARRSLDREPAGGIGTGAGTPGRPDRPRYPELRNPYEGTVSARPAAEAQRRSVDVRDAGAPDNGAAAGYVPAQGGIVARASAQAPVESPSVKAYEKCPEGQLLENAVPQLAAYNRGLAVLKGKGFFHSMSFVNGGKNFGACAAIEARLLAAYGVITDGEPVELDAPVKNRICFAGSLDKEKIKKALSEGAYVIIEGKTPEGVQSNMFDISGASLVSMAGLFAKVGVSSACDLTAIAVAYPGWEAIPEEVFVNNTLMRHFFASPDGPAMITRDDFRWLDGWDLSGGMPVELSPEAVAKKVEAKKTEEQKAEAKEAPKAAEPASEAKQAEQPKTQVNQEAPVPGKKSVSVKIPPTARPGMKTPLVIKEMPAETSDPNTAALVKKSVSVGLPQPKKTVSAAVATGTPAPVPAAIKTTVKVAPKVSNKPADEPTQAIKPAPEKKDEQKPEEKPAADVKSKEEKQTEKPAVNTDAPAVKKEKKEEPVKATVKPAENVQDTLENESKKADAPVTSYRPDTGAEPAGKENIPEDGKKPVNEAHGESDKTEPEEIKKDETETKVDPDAIGVVKVVVEDEKDDTDDNDEPDDATESPDLQTRKANADVKRQILKLHKDTYMMLKATRQNRYDPILLAYKQAYESENYKFLGASYCTKIYKPGSATAGETDFFSTSVYKKIYESERKVKELLAKIQPVTRHVSCFNCRHTWDEDVSVCDGREKVTKCPKCEQPIRVEV